MTLQVPPNPFKRAIRERRPQIGLWCSLCSNIVAEIIAGAGFDWILIDTEHAPNELPIVLGQLQALVGGTAAPIVRPAWNDTVLLKRLLDTGVQNFLIPFVQTAEEARAAVAATRYPPTGVRGVAVTHRANQYGRVSNYYEKAGDEICVLVQIESKLALQNLEAIAAIDGVDGLFIGPSDLAAALGHLGNPSHPEVRAVIEPALKRIVKRVKHRASLRQLKRTLATGLNWARLWWASVAMSRFSRAAVSNWPRGTNSQF